MNPLFTNKYVLQNFALATILFARSCGDKIAE